AVAARPPAQPPAAPPPPPPAEPPAPEPARPAVEARTDRLATNQGDGALHRLRQQETLRLMAEYLGDLEGQRVLDLGCGAGRFALPLVKAEVLGVDAASDLIENARARHAGLSNFRFLAADPARLELAEQPFDVTLLVDALAAADEGAAALLASAAAHTRPGGLLFLSVDNRDALDRRAARRMGGVPRGAGGSHGLTQAETTSMVRAAGFRPLRCDGVVLPWGSALGADNDEILEALRELGRLAGPAYAQGIVMLARKG
ncbi:MAG: bifunctional 3-demethylubiquinone-9 3-methyltransferase/2-octaprenyl-6-hydroxy phenol methylase, partial [Roseomonas sp.]|nr:bifunctional 3-demethylubiquinone-9 3-methyltransferase/2-octaprenyl-6-hydroxy phenol methylase [Roseomonas sp.]